MNSADNIIGAFDEVSVAKLTGLSLTQLRYWDKTGFFKPSYAQENRRAPFSRVYSFIDVAGLRTLSILRRVHKVPLQHLRRVAERLSDMDQSLWAKQKLYVLKREVYFTEPETGQRRGVVSGQYACIELKAIVDDVTAEVKALRERSDDTFGKIEKRRNVSGSEPIIAGTRIRVSTILAFHREGYSVDQIIQEFPTLKREDVEAAIRHGDRKAA